MEKKARRLAEEKLLEGEKKPDVQAQREEALPRKDRGQTFLVREIRLKSKGVEPEGEKILGDLKRDLEPLVKECEGRELALEDLRQLGRKIEEAYRKRGYFAYSYIPPQPIENGEVTLEILLSRMGDLQIQGTKYFRASKTKSYWNIPKGKILNYGQIRKSTLESNQNPDRTVRPNLKAGTEPGTTDIYLRSEEHFPVHGGFSFDNQGVDLTGKKNFGFTLRDNNLLSLDDIFLIGTLFGRDFGLLYLHHLIPITTFGTQFIWGLSHTEARLEAYKSTRLNSISQIYNLLLRQRLFATDRFRAHAQLGFDIKEKRTRNKGVVIAWDRLRVLKPGLTVSAKDKTCVSTLNQDFSVGFSPHGDGFALTTRQAESHFLKYEVSLHRRQTLPFGTYSLLNLKGQLSLDRLPPQEQLFLGGAHSVRGYPESDYGADQGMVVNIEHYLPLYFIPPDWHLFMDKTPLRKQVEWITFLDQGAGIIRRAQSTEEERRYLMGVGGGLQVQFRDNISARLEWGIPVGNSPLSDSGKYQFHFSLRVDV